MTNRFTRSNNGAKRLGDILRESVLPAKRAGNRNKYLREKWRKVAGDDMSGHTEVEMMKEGVLYIKVDSAMWLHHLSFKKEELLASVQSELKRGYISDLKFRVGVF